MRIFAAMDIGTNSVRLAVVEVKSDDTWTTLASQKQVVRLGEGEFSTAASKKQSIESTPKHLLTEEAIGRGALVCARFAEVARGFGAEEIVALATAAVREADNQDDFVSRVRNLADLDVRVISGHEEARLIYLGVASGIEWRGSKKALFMDIGGGSTELMVGDRNNYTFLDSLKLGAIRLTSEFLPDTSRPITPAAWATLCRHITSVLAPAARAIKSEGFSIMYGSSGTAMNLAEIAAYTSGSPIPTSFRNYVLTLPEVQAITKRLCAMTVEQRRRVPGINPERADIIIGGSAILQTTMEIVGAASITISDRGLREGIVVDRLRRSSVYSASNNGYVGARMRSVRQLMAATKADSVHAEHIVHLALSLFDQWKELGLHDYGRARELLEYAALLHDCGFFVSHTDHQQHSYYLIRHSELLGFNDREVEIMANVALYHRKATPRKRHPNFAQLDAKTQRLVKVLSCALRLAEALDRSHLMLVKSVSSERLTHPDRISLSFDGAAEAQLEVWAAQGQALAFQKLFGLPLVVNGDTAGI